MPFGIVTTTDPILAPLNSLWWIHFPPLKVELLFHQLLEDLFGLWWPRSDQILFHIMKAVYRIFLQWFQLSQNFLCIGLHLTKSWIYQLSHELKLIRTYFLTFLIKIQFFTNLDLPKMLQLSHKNPQLISIVCMSALLFEVLHDQDSWILPQIFHQEIFHLLYLTCLWIVTVIRNQCFGSHRYFFRENHQTYTLFMIFLYLNWLSSISLYTEYFRAWNSFKFEFGL